MTLGGPAPTAPSFFSSLFSLPWKQCTVAPYVDPVAFFAGTSVFYSVSEEGREFSPCSPSNCSRSPSLLRTVISACPLCPSVPHWIPGNYEKVLHRLYCTLHVKALGWCWQKHSTLRFISPVWVLMCPGEPVPGSPEKWEWLWLHLMSHNQITNQKASHRASTELGELWSDVTCGFRLKRSHFRKILEAKTYNWQTDGLFFSI